MCSFCGWFIKIYAGHLCIYLKKMSCCLTMSPLAGKWVTTNLLRLLHAQIGKKTESNYKCSKSGLVILYIRTSMLIASDWPSFLQFHSCSNRQTSVATWIIWIRFTCVDQRMLIQATVCQVKCSPHYALLFVWKASKRPVFMRFFFVKYFVISFATSSARQKEEEFFFSYSGAAGKRGRRD